MLTYGAIPDFLLIAHSEIHLCKCEVEAFVQSWARMGKAKGLVANTCCICMTTLFETLPIAMTTFSLNGLKYELCLTT